MPREGNGTAWHVSFVGVVAHDVKTLYKQAKEVGLGQVFVNSIRFAIYRMRLNPLSFGELIRRRPKSGLIVHIRVVEPLLFEFAIHEETHNVLIQRVQFMP